MNTPFVFHSTLQPKWGGALAGLGLLVGWASTSFAGPAGPGWIMPTGEPVTPREADLRLAASVSPAPPVQKALAAPEGALAEPPTPTVDPEIADLARSLDHDPKLIFEFVRDHVDYVPYLGALKGVLGTYLDEAGNDFDQAALVIALLRASGYTATYQYGTMTIPRSVVANWLGSARNYTTLLSWGGIPYETDPTGQALVISRVWVKASVDGSDRILDPALKNYQETEGCLNLASAMGYDRTELRAAVGGTVTADYVRNLNDTALRDKLKTYCSNLLSAIRSQYPNATLDELIGGRSIQETGVVDLPAETAYPATVTATWDEIPLAYTTTLRVQHLGIDHTFATGEISGRRLTISYAGGDNHPELRLEGELIASGSGTTSGSSNDITLTLDYPYADQDGSYYDQTDTTSIKSGSMYSLVTQFVDTSDAWIAQRRRTLERNQQNGCAEGSEAVLGESLNIAGQVYFREDRLAQKLLGRLARTVPVRQHYVGFCKQEGQCPGIDLRFNGWYWVGKNRTVYGSYDQYEQEMRCGSTDSAFEHAIWDQLFSEPGYAVSTVRLFHVANTQGLKTFLVTADNCDAVQPQLSNYPTASLTEWIAQVKSGEAEWYLLPQNGSIQVRQWRGCAALGRPGSSLVGGWLINGNLLGGDVTDTVPNGEVNSGAENAATASQNNANSSSCAGLPQLQTPEPVNMGDGSYEYANTDLSLGGPTPRGLGFTRYYNSGQGGQSRCIGHGWTHGCDIYLEKSSDGISGLGERQPADAAPFLVAATVVLDQPQQPKDALTWMLTTLVYQWAMDQLTDNSLTVHLGSKNLAFTRMPDGSYVSPPGVTSTLSYETGAPPPAHFRLYDRFGVWTKFNTEDRAEFVQDADGNTLAFSYANGKLTTVTDAFGRTLTFQYSGENLASVTDSAGRSVQYSYSGAGDLTGSVDAEGYATAYTYDSDHRLTAITNPLGIVTVTNSYDAFGRVATQVFPRQDGVSATYEYRFPRYHNVQQDPYGNRTTYRYNRSRLPIGIEDALGNETQTRYDGQNHQVEITDALGRRTIYSYDGNHNIVKETDALGNSTRFIYDAQHRRTDTIDPFGNRVQCGYDAYHHLTSICNELGNITAFTYNANGLLSRVEDPRGNASTFTYDAQGLPENTRNGTRPAITTGYGASGELEYLVDEGGARTSFERTPRGHVISRTDPLGGSIESSYDAAGQLVAVTDRKGQTITFTYTPFGELETAIVPGYGTIQMAYNANGDLVEVQSPLGATSYTYDRGRRLQLARDCFDQCVGYGYDAAGNLATLIYPGNKAVEYEYDETNRLTLVRVAWLGKTARLIYDRSGRLKRITNFNGTETVRCYDAAGHLTTLEHRKADGGIICLFGYTPDPAGNRIGVRRVDPLGWFPLPASVAYQYNTQKNRLQSAGGDLWTWDAEGQISADGGNNYEFDALHRLRAVSGGATASFDYDGQGRRMRVERSGIETRFVYDASGRVIAECDASGEVRRYYIYGDELMAVVDAADSAYCYHFDGIGSAIALSDGSQNVVNMYAYDSFGRVGQSVEAIPQPFRFVGRYGVMWESPSLYYMKARFYDCDTGRFVSEDPSGFEGGSGNLYQYAGNNPLGAIDPTGLCGESGGDSGGIFGVIARWWKGLSLSGGVTEGVSWGVCTFGSSITTSGSPTATIQTTAGCFPYVFSWYNTVDWSDVGVCWSPSYGYKLGGAGGSVGIDGCVGTDGIHLDPNASIGSNMPISHQIKIIEFSPSFKANVVNAAKSAAGALFSGR